MSPPKTFLILKYALFCALDFVLFACYIYFLGYDFFLFVHYHAFTPPIYTLHLLQQRFIKACLSYFISLVLVTLLWPLDIHYCVFIPFIQVITQRHKIYAKYLLYRDLCAYNILLLSCRGYKVQFYTVDKYKSIHNSFSQWLAVNMARQMQVMWDGGISHYSTK